MWRTQWHQLNLLNQLNLAHDIMKRDSLPTLPWRVCTKMCCYMGSVALQGILNLRKKI
jgi:hypothetical protein